jgi:hypothetical protein
MFDFIIGEATEQSGGPIDVTVTQPSLINSVALFGVKGSTAQVIVTDASEGEVYNRTVDLNDNTGINNWYSYFFAPIVKVQEAIFTDLPAYAGADVRIVVDNGDNDTAIGEAVLGRQRNLGVTLMGFQFGIEDFSRKERDIFGNFVVIERRFAKLAQYDVFLENAQVNEAFSVLASNRARAVVYIGSENKRETVTLGFFRDFSTLRTGPVSSEMTLEVEGLT